MLSEDNTLRSDYIADIKANNKSLQELTS